MRVVKLVTIKFLDIEVEPSNYLRSSVILNGIRMNFFHCHSFLSDVLFSRCSSFLHTYLDKFEFLRNLFRRLVISIVRLFFSKVGYNLLVPVYTNCPSGWLLVFTRRQDNLYDFSRKTSNCANTFAQLSVRSLGKGWFRFKETNAFVLCWTMVSFRGQIPFLRGGSH